MIFRPVARFFSVFRMTGLSLVFSGVLVAVTGVHAREAGEPADVRWQPASQLFVYPRREASASVLARNESQISAELAAVIKKIPVDVGQTVKAGDVLAVLDQTDAQLNLAQVQAQRNGLQARLRLARDQLKRARELKTNNFVSADAVSQRTVEVVSLRAELAAVDAQVAIAESRIGKTTIRSPYDAVVSLRQAQLGELTSPGAVLFSLVERGGERVAAQVPSTLAQAIDQRPPTQFSFVSGDLKIPVRLTLLSPVITRASRTREARFAFVDQPLSPGLEGRIVWPDGGAHLPAVVMVQRDGEQGVFTVDNEMARFVPVPGAREGRPALTQLPPETPIIMRGQARLQTGDPISARQLDAAGSAR